jgi:putative ABC transport system permease protein
MNFPGFIRKSAFRNRFRTVLTITGMAIAVLAFLFLRTVVDVWNAGIGAAAQDRLATRHKISITMQLPRTYVDKVKNLPGVNAVTWANWFGAVNPQDEHAFFAQFAIDDGYMDVYNEVVIPPDQMKAWKEDPQGAIIGEGLAQKYGWKLGDKVTLRGTIYPGDWVFNVRAIYTTTSKAFDKMTFMFHWKYMNETVPERRKEMVGWLGVRVNDPTQGPAVSAAIDKLFDPTDYQTLTESERAFNLSFNSMYAAVFTAKDIVSIVIMLIMTMIVGNTIAMNVRDRTNEYGVLRAIGFKPKHLGLIVVGETAIVAVLGALIGVALAVPLVNGFGVFIEDNMGAMFPFFAVAPTTIVLAIGLAIGLGLLSGALPAFAAARVPVTSALRRVG